MQTLDLTLAILARAVADASNNNNEKPINQSRYENIECPKPLPSVVGTGDPLFGSGTPNFHTFATYLSGAALGLTLISTLFLSWRHLHSYTSPQEQRQILRIVNLPLAYGIFNFLALVFTLDYMYIEPLGAVYESFAVAALFLLMLEYVCPDGTDRERFFQQTEMRGKKGVVVPGGSLAWYKTTYASVLQYPLLKTILIVIQIVTQYFGDFCESSFSPKHAHLWLTLADLLFIGGALGATIKFSMRFKNDYPAGVRGRAKVWTFIGIIIFQIIQGLLFHLLNGKLFHPTHKLTYNDLNFGMASVLTCAEALIFSLIFHWSFSSTAYAEGTKRDRLDAPAKRKSTFRAVLDALNMADVVAGTISAMGMLGTKVLARFAGGRGASGGRGGGVGLEALGGRPKTGDKGEYSYAAGYHAPPVPVAAARDPSPGRAPAYGDGELRPGMMAGGESYSGYGYDRRVSGDGDETMPLRETRGMV